MFFEQQRIRDVKREILKEVFQDNLRISGKLNANSPRPTRHSIHGKGRRVALIVVLTLLCSFSARDISPSVKRPSTAMDAAVPRELRPAVSPLAARPAQIPQDNGVGEMVIPIWDFVPSTDQSIADYDLLLSRKDDVRVSNVLGLNVKTIVIDPGHGGTDPGAIGALGSQEKDITLDVALRLKQKLTQLGRYNILLTRDSDTTISLAERVSFAKEHKADLFISVHVNSLPNHTINIIETYYFGPPLTSETMQLAEQENKGSHFTFGELDAIVKDFGKTVKRQESVRLAMAIQEKLYRYVKSRDDKVRDEGIKMAPFVVLSQTEVPSVLVEISCLTKKKEEVKLSSPPYRDKIAAYIQEGIVSYLDIQYFNYLRGEK